MTITINIIPVASFLLAFALMYAMVKVRKRIEQSNPVLANAIIIMFGLLAFYGLFDVIRQVVEAMR